MDCIFRVRLLPLALISAFLLSPLSCAQATSTPALPSSAYDVSLPVIVHNKKGDLVTTLKPSDIALTVDNQPLKINSFSIQSGQPFLLGLLLQTTHGMEGSRNDLKSAAGQFIDQMIPGAPVVGGGGNQAFLIHFDRAVELLSDDFTPQPAALHRELNTLGPTQINRHEGTQEQDPAGGTGAGSFGNSRTTNTLYDAIFLAADELMKTKQGRKVLIVFSDGVDRGSKESLTDAIDAADHANLTLYSVFFRGEERQGFNGFPGQKSGHPGGIGFPGGWPGGGGGGHSGGGNEPKPAIEGKKIMEQLSNRTGGHFFEVKRKEALADVFSEIATELKGQYLLTFTPEKPDPDGGYHKITLKTGDATLKLQTREGYYASDAQQ